MAEQLSRRNFLKGSSIIAGGAAALGIAGASSASPVIADEAAPDSATALAEGMHYRPEPNSREVPSPMTTGHIGEDAKPIPPVAVPEAWDEEFDIVVVGSGLGGLTAAAIGAAEGSKTLLIEKSYVTGGASRHAAGNAILAGGTKAQEEMGYHWPGDTYDPMAAAAKYQDYCQWTVDDELLLAAIESGKDWGDWMTDLPGMDWVCVGPAFSDREMIEGKYNAVLANDNICNTLEQNALEHGADIRVLIECKALVQDGDRVVGIKVCDTAGTESFIKANKGVILTAGGFGMNLDLLEQYTPTAYMYATQGGPFPTHTGECFRMGLGVGADVSGYNSFSCWEGGLDEYWGNGDGNYFHYFWNGAKQVAQNPWFRIDRAGNRMEFINVNSTDGIQQENWTMESGSCGDLTNAARWSSAVGHRAYAFFDANFEESLKVFQETATPAIDDHRRPLTDDGRTKENDYVTTDWKAEFEAAVDRGAISKADTFEELAEMLGLNPDKVVKAIDHWNNDICASGKDTDLPVPYKDAWLIPLTTPPYYGFAIGGQISKTMTGLRVNPKMQVVNMDGDPIPGLYAGWYTAGGLGGDNNYGGQFGNCTIFASAAASGVGGYMAIKGLLETEE